MDSLANLAINTSDFYESKPNSLYFDDYKINEYI